MSIWEDIGSALGTRDDDRDKENANKVGLDPTAYRRQNALNNQARENARRYENLAKNENYQNRQNELDYEKARNQRREAPVAYSATVGPLSNAKSAEVDRAEVGGPSSFRGNSQNLIQSLENSANGIGPSLAEIQYRKNQERNLKGLMAMAASVRGGRSPGGTLRNLADAQAQVQGQAALDSAELRLQEQQIARQQLGQAIGTGLGYDTGYRGQQIGMASQDAANQQQVNLANSNAWNQARMAEAGFNQQSSLANQQAQMNLLGLNQQSDQYYNNQMLGLDREQLAARLAAAQMFQNEQMQANSIASGQQLATTAGQTTPSEVFKTVTSAGAGAASAAGSALVQFSDENLKENVSDASKKQSEEFLKQLSTDENGQPVAENQPSLPSGGGSQSPLYLANLIRFGGNMTRADLESNPMLMTTGGWDMGTGRASEAKNRVAGITRPSGRVQLSDENQKKNVHSSVGKSMSFLNKLEPKTYEYKDERYGSGKQLGFMAQDLEKSGPIGKSLVMNTPQGKMVDYSKAVPIVMANSVEQNKRIDEIEKKLANKRKK